MVNYDRIVPITKIDFLSLIGTVLTLNETTFTVAEASNVEGDFVIAEAGTYLANQPVKSFDFGAATTGTVYFVADNFYEGFKVAGAEATVAEGSAEVETASFDLYKAVLASGFVTITAITPVIK